MTDAPKNEGAAAEGQNQETPKTPEADPAVPSPIQIVSIGTEENAYAFTFHEEDFLSILSKIPPGWKVSVVSVVGAFRTGKSFLLSWFLKYLHFHDSSKAACGEEGKEWFHAFDKLDRDAGFHWRGGADRNTTGIWMWSEPFFVHPKEGPDSRTKEPIAVILVDTQGMFDHETTMGLTASIFGLSTLLSSYQIYNVDKRIQEDNLQQLALFSEYGRIALDTGASNKDDDDVGGKKVKPLAHKPFQTMEFLVRDWQNFECDGEGDFKDIEEEMDDYLTSVISERDAKDLKETREQIQSCFEEIKCFMFTHPGFAVTKKKYDGTTKDIDPSFLRLLDRFCQRVLGGENLHPKKIHGRELSAAELGAYVKAYAKLFANGAHFPEAGTMLDATANANNFNATNDSLHIYKEKMDNVCGPNKLDYVKMNELEEAHEEIRVLAIEEFKRRANFGNKANIEKSKRDVLQKIDQSWDMYSKLNEGRNPLAGLEVLLVPLIIAFVSFLLRFIADSTCSSWSQTCKASSDILAEVYTIFILFLMLVGATKFKQIQDLFAKIKGALGVMMEGDGKKPEDGSKKEKQS